jgi:hypothetical protein
MIMQLLDRIQPLERLMKELQLIIIPEAKIQITVLIINLGMLQIEALHHAHSLLQDQVLHLVQVLHDHLAVTRLNQVHLVGDHLIRHQGVIKTLNSNLL